MSNRKKATDWFIAQLKELGETAKPNVEFYQQYFESLSDKQFDELMGKLERGEYTLPYFYSNLSKAKMKIDTILKLADKLGIKFFQRLELTDPVSGVRYKTPDEYFVVMLPVRRQQQHLSKKKSIVEHSKFTDPLSGQATGISKSSKMSFPELMIVESAGLYNSIEELIKVRGGDVDAFRTAKRLTIEQGGYNLDTIRQLDSRPTSIETLRAILFAMHFENNL